MRLRFIWVGKTRDEHLRALTDRYFVRLNGFTQCQLIEVGEARAKDVKAGIQEESRRILRALLPGDFIVLLDVKGSEWTSPETAHQLDRWRAVGTKDVAFIVGGPNGVSGAVTCRAGLRWSLSKLTMTHEIIRVVLLEQIYRAFTIINHIPYHK